MPAAPDSNAHKLFLTATLPAMIRFLVCSITPFPSGFEFPEARAGYDQVLRKFQDLQWPCAAVHFYIRLDAAGQYATNLETFLRSLPFPKTLTVGEPARNQHYASGLGKDGCAKPGRRTRMSPRGNDLVRKYLWNAARAGISHNPALRALFGRLRGRGVRGDVALGHCMRKLLHLVFAVWKTGKPFDRDHYPWEPSAPAETAAADQKTAGHNQDEGPEGSVVTAATSTVTPAPPSDNAAAGPPPLAAPEPPAGGIDYAALRSQISMEQVLAQLGCLTRLKGCGVQRRGPCPIHAAKDPSNRSFSVNLDKKVFQCFHPPCGAHGNVLDLWAAVQRLPLYEAAQHLAATLHVSLTASSGTEKRNP